MPRPSQRDFRLQRMHGSSASAAGSPILLVLGMHRSGTSATTALLGKLGVGMAATQMEFNVGNPKGYWESVRLHDFHEGLLSEAASCWNDWNELAIAPDAARAEAMLEVLGHEFDLDGLCAVKDPRMCRMMPFWRDAAARGGLSPRILVPYRNPVEVAASLVERGGGMTGEHGLLLWLRHVLDAEAQTRDLPRVFFRYEHLIDDWRGTVARMERGLGLKWPVPPAQATPAIEAFLDTRLRRQVAADEEARALHPWFAHTLAALDWLAGDDPDPTGAQATLDTIREELNAACRRFRSPPDAAGQRPAPDTEQLDRLRALLASR